jgi:hypothetical protein
MLKTVLFTVLFAAQSVFAGFAAFPSKPEFSHTPGETCERPSTYRYPERIAYCERDVDSETKRAIIAEYDRAFGYKIRTMPRNKFKIDHYIPLCMGGSNRVENLWPQHESVYKITDPLEALLCQKMAEGVLKQADAIDMIKRAKNNLNEAQEIFRRAQDLH